MGEDFIVTSTMYGKLVVFESLEYSICKWFYFHKKLRKRKRLNHSTTAIACSYAVLVVFFDFFEKIELLKQGILGRVRGVETFKVAARPEGGEAPGPVGVGALLERWAAPPPIETSRRGSEKFDQFLRRLSPGVNP